ncbi:ABC transporter permease [Actinomycetaceae bacterium L2_0104]
MRSRHGTKWLPSLVLGATLLLVWWIVTTFGFVDTHFLPSPQETIERLISGLRSGYLVDATAATLLAALAGCALATVIGVPLGYLVGKSRAFSRMIQPYLAASQAIPAVAVAPLLTIWIGYGRISIVVLCTVMVIFPVVVSTSVGIRHIDADILGAAKLDGASGLTLVRTMELPLAAPAILAGLRTGFTLSITGAVVGEMIIGGNGLGMTLLSAQGSGDIKGMFASIVLLAASAMTIYGLISFVESRVNYLVRDTAGSHKWRIRAEAYRNHEK